MLQLQKRLLKTAAGPMIAFLTTLPVKAATIVDVHTPLGSFRMELFEELGNVGRFHYKTYQGIYDSTFIHYADDSYLAGGIYLYNSCSQGPVTAVAGDFSNPTIENGLANSRGTIALLRDPYNPAFLTSNWIINLDDNTTIDPNSAPVVIGEIISGFDVALAIRDQRQVAITGASTNVPAIQYQGAAQISCETFSPDNLVKVDMESLAYDNSRPNNHYNTGSNNLRIKVDAGNGGLWSVTFIPLSTESEVRIQAVPGSFLPEFEVFSDMATYDESSETLTVPELVVGGGTPFTPSSASYTNMVFKLSDRDSLTFTLESFDGAMSFDFESQ